MVGEVLFKKNNLGVTETVNRQFLNTFPTNIHANAPRWAWDTCNLHLDGLQSLLFVDPKKNGTETITWDEPKDLILFYESKAKWLWLAVSIIAFIFFLMIYYFWGI